MRSVDTKAISSEHERGKSPVVACDNISIMFAAELVLSGTRKAFQRTEKGSRMINELEHMVMDDVVFL